MVGDKPLVQVKPRGSAKAEAAPAKSAVSRNAPMAMAGPVHAITTGFG